MLDWVIPAPVGPWECIEEELPWLRRMAMLVEQQWPDVQCHADFQTPGCAFVNFFRDSVLVGRACVSVIDESEPHFSVYLGSNEDEFHGRNLLAAVSTVGCYVDSLPLE